MNTNTAVAELLRSANEIGVIATLYGAFGSCVTVRLPFGNAGCDTNVDDLDFSVRASNALKRAGIFTIGQAIDLIAGDGLLRIRNLGKKTQNEIKTRILAFGYERLTELEKKRFFCDMVERNGRK